MSEKASEERRPINEKPTQRSKPQTPRSPQWTVTSYLHNFYTGPSDSFERDKYEFIDDVFLQTGTENLKAANNPSEHREMKIQRLSNAFVIVLSICTAVGLIMAIVATILPHKVVIESVSGNQMQIDQAAVNYNLMLGKLQVLGLILFGSSISALLIIMSFRGTLSYFCKERSEPEASSVSGEQLRIRAPGASFPLPQAFYAAVQPGHDNKESRVINDEKVPLTSDTNP